MHSDLAIKASRAVLSLALLVSAGAFASVLLGGRVFTLGADEVWFLAEAYALKQGWTSQIAFESLPYDLYLSWLGLPLASGTPETLWISVWMDTFAQLTSIALIIALVFKFRETRDVVSSLAIVCGVLFFFSIGRLAEHRPEFFSVTFLLIGSILLLEGWLSPREKHGKTLALVSGLFFALAVCFSPRALVLLAFSAPLLAGLTSFQLGFRRMIGIAIGALLGFLSMIALLSLSGVFSFPSSLQFLLTSEHGPTGGISFSQRLLEGIRPYLVIVTVITFFSAIGTSLFTSSRRAKLSAGAAACFAAGQLFLIWFDARIYEYGYSFGLVPFLLLYLSLAAGLGAPARASWSVLLPTLLYSLVFLYQVPSVKKSENYFYKRTLVMKTDVGEDDSTRALFKELSVGNNLSGALRARIILCNRFKDFYFVTHWAYNPVCLRNGFEQLAQVDHLAQQDSINSAGRVRNVYPSNRQLRSVLKSEELPEGSRGMLFRVQADGDITGKIDINK